MHIDLSQASDLDLLRLSATRDDAFSVFYRRYERMVAGWLVHRTGRTDLAADLTAEVFAAAYIAAPRFRAGPEPAGAWLLGIARHKLLRSLRRERIDASARRRLALERVEITDEALTAIQELRECGLLALLDELPVDQREAVRARIIDEVDYVDLAASLAITPTVARKRVSRGVASLRRRAQLIGNTL